MAAVPVPVPAGCAGRAGAAGYGEGGGRKQPGASRGQSAPARSACRIGAGRRQSSARRCFLLPAPVSPAAFPASSLRAEPKQPLRGAEVCLHVLSRRLAEAAGSTRVTARWRWLSHGAWLPSGSRLPVSGFRDTHRQRCRGKAAGPACLCCSGSALR